MTLRLDVYTMNIFMKYQYLMEKYNIQNKAINLDIFLKILGVDNKYVISNSNIVPQFQDGLIFEFFVTS